MTFSEALFRYFMMYNKLLKSRTVWLARIGRELGFLKLLLHFTRTCWVRPPVSTVFSKAHCQLSYCLPSFVRFSQDTTNVDEHACIFTSAAEESTGTCDDAGRYAFSEKSCNQINYKKVQSMETITLGRTFLLVRSRPASALDLSASAPAA